MKKIVLLVALCLCVGNLFAQDADKLRDEGDAALKAKDYATVVTKYGEYLKQNNYQDTARIFNCGYAANQAKNYAEAAKYFDMAVKMNYNVDDSYVGEAMAYRNLNKTEEFLTTVKEGLKVIPDGNKNKTNLEKLLYGYCIKQGQAAQKKGDLAGAEKMYKEVLAVSNKDYQSNAYYSLGAMLYGNGAKILQAATPIATSEPDKYNAEKAKADKDFKQAKEYLTKAVELDPKDENSKKNRLLVHTLVDHTGDLTISSQRKPAYTVFRVTVFRLKLENREPRVKEKVKFLHPNLKDTGKDKMSEFVDQHQYR